MCAGNPPLGRPLMELAILTTAREHDQPYEWSLHEMEAVAVGLDPEVIEVVRHRRPLTGLGDKEAVIIQVGREIFGRHHVTSDTYRRAVTLLGESNLVDVVDLMARYAGTAARLTAFNQHMPRGWPQFLPLPFTLPGDIDPDSRSRLPLIRGPAERRQTTPSLYGRTLSPEGTGPGHIRRHGAGRASLKANVPRPLVDLAILVTAREYDVQYDWTVTELAAIEGGLHAAVIGHRPPSWTGHTTRRQRGGGAHFWARALWHAQRERRDLCQHCDVVRNNQPRGSRGRDGATCRRRCVADRV